MTRGIAHERGFPAIDRLFERLVSCRPISDSAVPNLNAMETLLTLSQRLEAGKTTSVELLQAALAAIDNPRGEGERAFLLVDREGAQQAAEQADRHRSASGAPSPFCGIPIAIKDLFDIQGQVTRAGSRLLAESPAATADAVAIGRLRKAGFVLVGRTNMTEFAYSGLGLNPHYGTPLNPYDRASRRIPGGSSSGAAVSVVDGMAAAAIGTDTGGSCRIPAAMCGLVGYKPTASRIPRTGVLPLSDSLDSVGPLAASARCCAILDRIMSGADGKAPTWPAPALKQIKLGIPQHFVLNGLDAQVSAAFDRAVRRLGTEGAQIIELDFKALDELPAINSKGGLAAAEAFAWHRHYLQHQGERYDPRVRVRIAKGAEQSAADYIELRHARQAMIGEAQRLMQGLDGLIYPTVPMIAPRLAELEDDGEYARLNVLALRNPSVANFLDTCAISIPIHDEDEPPVGLNILGHPGRDEALFAVAGSLETAVSKRR